ncbi:MAG: hypothetical protein ACKO85_10225 [Isosphaeraceae bacterium]
MPTHHQAARRLKPHTTGICLAAGLVALAAIRNSPRVYVQGLRWLAVGVGIAALATHILQRVDESLDSRRWARRKKLQILAQMASVQKVTASSISSAEPESGIDGAIIEAAIDSPVHFNETPFEDDAVPDVSHYADKTSGTITGGAATAPLPVDLRVAFEEAMLDGNWLSATEAYRASMEAGELISTDEAELGRLRKSSLEFIFQRMHSGTVKDDVASLARNLTQIFPLSTEGRTLAPVLGVLRRSAGLCPRCEKPYRGVANACHDCLRGTPEAYQIAWDDQPI